jgi:uncharacterized membrane protein
MGVNSTPYNSEPTLAQLVSDLVSDAKLLLRQELALAKYEIQEEVGKTKSAFVSLGIGAAVTAIGGLLLVLMLVHGLNALTGWPLWTCYAIVGAIFVLVGLMMLYRGKSRMMQIELVPPQTVETMKENLRWIKEKAVSDKI